jgi:hypothetical protein
VNAEERKTLLAESLRAAAIKAQEEDNLKAQIARVTALVTEKLKHVHASDDDLICPGCGYKGPESDFEPDTNEESDGCSTDDETSDTGGDSDSVEELDAAGKKRVVAELLARKRRR